MIQTIQPSGRLLWLCCLLLSVGLVPAQGQSNFSAALDKILASPALKGGMTGAMVCRVSDGRVLYAQNADLRLLPASNRKLFTSAAALELLGDAYTLHTDLCASMKPDAEGVIAGDLCLRGGGDGLLSPSDLDAMALILAQSGVKRVEGNIVGDGSLFTDGPYGFGWEWDDFSDEEFPQIAGLEVNEGVLGVHVAPGSAPGDPVTATLSPATSYLSVIISARTGTKDAADDCAVSRPWDKNLFQVTGTLPLGATKDINVPVQNPPLLAATLLRESLMRLGIVVTGIAVTAKTPAAADVVLSTHRSLPLALYIARMNKTSDNLLAESLVRLLGVAGGGVGSYDTGYARETPFFASLGVDTDPMALVDGCGVGRRNFVTARAVTQLLLGMRRKPDWRVYYDSLPIAGVDGTLQTRMKGTPAAGHVHAKTGTLSQVRALSGYVTGHSGGLYVFSLLMNNFPGTAHQAGTVQDQFVEKLIAWL